MSNRYIVEVWLDKDGWQQTPNTIGKWTHPGRPETITVGPRGGVTIEGAQSERNKTDLLCRINVFRNCWLAATSYLTSFQ